MERLKQMPIGTQHFREIREKDSMYVDKTQIIHTILNADHKKYFLSRPRRFGKSLLLDTIAELYSGEKSEELFKGLWIAGKWDFKSMHRPVVKYLFASSAFQTAGLEVALRSMLIENGKINGIGLVKTSIGEMQSELLKGLYEKHGKVVILVDEYDKPITEYLENDMPLALANRDLLRGFYAPFKDLGDKIELLFITGIARFTKTSLFSDLNHLKDLSMDGRAAAICGITQEELERDFGPYLPKAQEALNCDREHLLGQLREWYNGYRFCEQGPSVYNPFSLINFFDSNRFGSYWYQSGMPKMMRKYFRPGEFREFDQVEATEELLQSFDLESLDIISLMFQAGYLTLSGYDSERMRYSLAYPNQEVARMFQYFYLSCQSNLSEGDVNRLIFKLQDVFYLKEYDDLQPRLNALLEILTYEMFTKHNEMLYHSLLHIAFSLVGMHTESEVHTKNGRCDMMIKARGVVHVLEFKFDQSADVAMAQLKTRGYAQKWISQGLTVIGFGININKETKSVNEVLWERLVE